MFEYFNYLLHFRAKYRPEVQESKTIKLNNAIVCLEQKIADAKIRVRKDHELIDDLRRRICSLSYELQETKRLARIERKLNISSISTDTDMIIDLLNELRTLKYEICLLRRHLYSCGRKIHKLRALYASAYRQKKYGEIRLAQLQIICARAEIAAAQWRFRANQYESQS